MQYFYSSSIRRLLIAFMTTFDKIYIRRYDDSGLKTPEHYKEIHVPIKFGPMSKYFQRRTEDASGQRYYVQLPTMAVTFGSFTFSSDRSVASKVRRHLLNPDQYKYPEDYLSDCMPSPWDIELTLAIKTESFQDFCQIIEQIVPWFNPSIYLHVKEYEDVNIDRNIQITLNGMTTDITEEVEEDGKRYVSGSLSFTASAEMYKPLSISKNMIKFINTHYGFDPDFNINGENYRTIGDFRENIEKIEATGTVTKGDLPNKDDFVYAETSSDNMGWANMMLEDGKPQHVPFVADVKAKSSPSVELTVETPTVETGGEP